VSVEVVTCGCAECYFIDEGPLIEVMTFESVAAAKAWAAEQGWLGPYLTWQPHPQGGEHVVVGQGSVWIRAAVLLDGAANNPQDVATLERARAARGSAR